MFHRDVRMLQKEFDIAPLWGGRFSCLGKKIPTFSKKRVGRSLYQAQRLACNSSRKVDSYFTTVLCTSVIMRRSVFSCFAFFSFFLPFNKTESDCASFCPTRWERFEDYCYFWPDKYKTWINAEKFCLAKGAHLASVTSLNIHNYIQSKF